MSGIAGIIHFDGRPVAPGQIEAMTAAMDYRGPDGINHWVQGSVALGQCMLRSTPESLEETQPLTNEDGSLVLVMDGRIDNWEELRRELLGRNACLRTRADAELFLRAYEAWGGDCLKHLEGDFAAAIWNTRTRSLFCARDHVGNRQFHYHWNGTSLAFATDLHPLLDLPWVPQAVDEGTLAEYLATDWLTIDTTLWEGIRRLKPAHRLTISDAGKAHFSEYWAPDPFATLPCATDAEYIEHYRELFTDVVRRTLRSHRPLSIEVSGGLDSSSIFATAMHLHAKGRLLAPGVEAYTLDFSGDRDADELDYALEVGRFHGASIRPIAPANLPLDWYGDVARRFRDVREMPNGAMHLGILELARDSQSRVLVAGTGGDEWSVGDEPHAELLMLRQWRALADLWREERKSLGRSKAGARLMRHGVAHLLPEPGKKAWRASRDWWRKAVIGRPDWLVPPLRQRFDALSSELTQALPPPIARHGQRRLQGLLYDPYWQFAKVRVEQRIALHRLDWRQPYWNRRIIEFAWACPDQLRRRGGVNRWLQRESARGLLPERVRLRADKAFFDVTFREQMAGLRARITESILARRADWILPDPLLAVMDTAFTPRSKHWDFGPPWMLFGLDACLGQSHDESCLDSTKSKSGA